MNLPKAHKTFILKQAGISIFMNVMMNGLMTWLMNKSHDYVTLWDENSFTIDLLMTTFFFTFFTSFFVSKASHKAIKSKTLSTIQSKRANKLLKKYPPKPFLGSLGLAIIVTLVISPIMIGVLTLTGNTTFLIKSFVIFKASYAGLLAVLITPLVSIISLFEAELIKQDNE